jgi:hypothetical protein
VVKILLDGRVSKRNNLREKNEPKDKFIREDEHEHE